MPPTQIEIAVDGFHFSLISYGYQPEATEYSAKEPSVAINVNDFLDEDLRARFLEALADACDTAESFDLIVKATDFVKSDVAAIALNTWEHDKLHSHALLCDAAIVASELCRLPLSDEVKMSLRTWNQAAAHKIYPE